jgi:hypothetical protein
MRPRIPIAGLNAGGRDPVVIERYAARTPRVSITRTRSASSIWSRNSSANSGSASALNSLGPEIVSRAPGLYCPVSQLSRFDARKQIMVRRQHEFLFNRMGQSRPSFSAAFAPMTAIPC